MGAKVSSWSRACGLRAAIGVVLGALLILAAADAAGAAPQKIIFDPVAEPWRAYIFSGSAPLDEPGGRAYDFAYDVRSRSNGASYVCGALGVDPAVSATKYNASLMKFVDGVPVWAEPRTYDSKYHLDEYAFALALASSGSVYTAGLSERTTVNADMHLIKWSSVGAVQWQRRYDGPGHGEDLGNAIVLDKAGNAIVAGPSVGADGSADWAVVTWSPSGARRWTWRYAGAGGDYDAPYDVLPSSDGSVYVAGNIVQAGVTRAMIARISPAGTLLWRRTYAGPFARGAEANALAARPGGGVYVCGSITLMDGSTDGLVVAYSPSGVRTLFPADGYAVAASSEVLNDVVVTTTGHVVAVGRSAVAENSSCHKVVYTSAGVMVNQSTLASAKPDSHPDADGFGSVVRDSLGGYVATGEHSTSVDKSEIIVERGSTLPGGGGFRSIWSPDGGVTGINSGWGIAISGGTVMVAGVCMPTTEVPETLMDHAVLVYVY